MSAKADQDDPRRWAALGVLLVGAFLPPLDFFIVNVALPSIRTDLHTTAGSLQLVVSGYATAYAVLLITGGRLGDLYGRRRVFIAGLLGFAAASALSGLAWNPGVLIVGRILQGLTAAVMAPQPLASINALFPDKEKPTALGFYAMAFGLASAAGLLLGGALVTANPYGLGWRSIFLINLPIVAVTVPAALALLKETHATSAQKLDGGGAALVGVALFALVLPLVEGRERGWPWWCWLSLVASAPLLFAFWRYEQRMSRRGGDPLLPPPVLAIEGMKQGLVGAFFFYFLAAFWLLFSVYEQTGRGRDPLATGLDILPAALGFFLGPLLSSRLAKLTGRFASPIGMVAQALGLVGTAAAVLTQSPGWLPAPLFAIGLGQGLALPTLTRTLTERVERKWSGLAAGLVSSTFQIGGALAVALVGGLFFSLMGEARRGPALDHAYAVGVTAIAASLLLAAGLMAGVSEPRAKPAPRAAHGHARSRRGVSQKGGTR